VPSLVNELERESLPRVGQPKAFQNCSVRKKPPLGKGKQLTGGTKNGDPKSILGIAASVMNLTSPTVQTALKSAKVVDAEKWINEQIGVSLQAQKPRAFSA